jgi:NOL1/NOP2/fmu family ribosome biogenesis protein
MASAKLSSASCFQQMLFKQSGFDTGSMTRARYKLQSFIDLALKREAVRETLNLDEDMK